MTEVMNVPELRFPGFSDGWTLFVISDVAKVYDGTHQTPKYVEKGVPFFSVEHVTANQFSETKFISEEVFAKENERVKLEKGDILMTRIGSIGNAKYIDWDVRASFYVSLALFKVFNSFHSKFFAQLIKSPEFQRELWKRTIHVAFPKKINLGEISHCKLIAPKLVEQQKVADFLSSVDKKIEQLTEKHRLLTEYKKGVMQQIFTQQIRFKDNQGNDYSGWRNVSFEDVGSFYYGKSAPKWSVTEDAKTPCIRYGELYSKFDIVVDAPKSFTNIEPEKLKFSRGGEVLIPRVGEDPLDFASASFLPISGVAIGEMISVFNTNENGLFLTYLINQSMKKPFARVVEGGNVSNLYFKYLENIEFEIPCLEEQQKIANFLTEIDHKIDQVWSTLEQTKVFKKGLLQKMFI